MIRVLAFIGGLLIAAPVVYGAPVVESVDRVVIPVSRLDRSVPFYTGALSFVADESGASSRCVLRLGIDHTAITAGDSERSIAFYRDLGLHIAGVSENWGIEQERLSGVPGARVRITALRAASGPGVELLQYLTPVGGRRMPPDTKPDDLWAEEVVLRTKAGAVSGQLLRDPDGHAIRIVADRKEASR